MHNPNDPHAGFQQLAAQAMVASSAMAYNINRVSDASQAASVASRFGDEPEILATSPRRRMNSHFSPNGKSGLPPPSPYSRYSMTNTKTGNRISLAPTVEEDISAAGPLPPDLHYQPTSPRPFRPSAQSRRSEQAYAARRSVATGGRRSVAVSRYSTAGSSDTDSNWAGEDEIDDLDWDVAKKDLSLAAKRWKLFWILAPLFISLILVAAGVLYLVYGSDQMVSNLQIWRLCFFFSGLPIIWWIGEGLTMACVWVVEHSKLFKVQNVLYYAYAVRVPLANVLRAALSLSWWALALTAWSKNQDKAVRKAFQIVLKLWACVTLFMTANLLKRLLAKILSSKFNKESHIQKIQDSLVKEYYLHMMLQPRDRSELDSAGVAAMGSGGDPQQETLLKKVGPGSNAHEVHVSARHAPPTFGLSLATSVRDVTSTLFGSNRSPAALRETGTVVEELLQSENTEGLQSPTSPTDIEAQTPTGAAADAVQRSDSSGRASVYSQKKVPLPAIPALARRGAGGRSSTQRRNRNSLAHETTPLNRTPSQFSARSARTAAQRRGSKLAPVVEAVADKKINPRGLTNTQMAKMEAYIRRHALQVTFRDELNARERQEEVTSEAEAKKLAFFLFWNVKTDLERNYLTVDDVSDFLPPGEAENAFLMLDRNGNGSVTLSECIAAVIEIFEARCDLALSLKDTKTVIGKLEDVIGVVIHILFAFLYLIVFNVDVVKTYLALSSLVLAFSFVFQNSIRTMYENVVFLFVVHPFDVGDVLAVGEGDAAQTYKVDQIDLHFTIFLSGNGARTWYANQKLITIPFSNISASGERGDSIKIFIDLDTPMKSLEMARAACEAVVAQNPTEFCEGVGLNIRECMNPMKIALVLGFKYSTNGADMGRIAKAKTLMHMALCEALTTEGVQYTSPPTKGAIDPGAAVDGSAFTPPLEDPAAKKAA